MKPTNTKWKYTDCGSRWEIYLPLAFKGLNICYNLQKLTCDEDAMISCFLNVNKQNHAKGYVTNDNYLHSSLQELSLEINLKEQTYWGVAVDLRYLVHFTDRVSLCIDLGPTARPSRLPMIAPLSQHPPRRINSRAICRLKQKAL
jgi:hypothetical protein